METKTLTKNLMIVCIRNGVEIPIEEERAKILIERMEKQRFISIDDKIINTADIVGIFPASDIENVTRRRNGEFQHKGEWLPKGTIICKCGNVLSYGKQCGLCG